MVDPTSYGVSLDSLSRPERPCRQHGWHVLNSEAPTRVALIGQTQGELA
jgi:hypothetical protein